MELELSEIMIEEYKMLKSLYEALIEQNKYLVERQVFLLDKIVKVIEERSKNVAKERLQLVLIHDRNDISPEILNSLRIEMIATIKKYLEIDENGIEIELDKADRSVALVANIPLKTMNRKIRGRVKRD